eukprot:12195442-Alexandrium_andersonii.AAC.1
MGMEDGRAKLYSVWADTAKKYPRSYAAWLAKGTSRLGEPNPHLLYSLGAEGIEQEDVIIETDVEVWSIRALAREYGIKGVD